MSDISDIIDIMTTEGMSKDTANHCAALLIAIGATAAYERQEAAVEVLTRLRERAEVAARMSFHPIGDAAVRVLHNIAPRKEAAE